MAHLNDSDTLPLQTKKIKHNPAYLPTVTIITSVYNEEDKIQQTLESLIESNYPQEKKQIIIVNDGSTDKTWEKIEQYIKHPNSARTEDLENHQLTVLSRSLKQLIREEAEVQMRSVGSGPAGI